MGKKTGSYNGSGSGIYKRADELLDSMPARHIDGLPPRIRLELGNGVRQMMTGYGVLYQHLVSDKKLVKYIDAGELQRFFDVVKSFALGGDIGVIADELQTTESDLVNFLKRFGLTEREIYRSGNELVATSI